MIYSAIVFLPAIGCLIAGLFGRVIGARGSELVTTSLLIVSCVLSWIVFWRVGFEHETARVVIERWITSGELDISWAFRIDTLTAVMFVVVTTVSALVHIYSIGYMHEDPARPWFFAYLSGFTFAMLMLVTADNLAQMFFGWEGVGLFSYLLIGFWYTKPEANAAAIKAFVVNRVGDFGFALGIFGLFAVFRTINLDQVFDGAGGVAGQTFEFLGYQVDILTTLCLLLFMGAMGKSAQFLLHTWLPDAMEGPTPVSALIHAATMVTAGVFMVARLSPIFEHAPVALDFVILIGSITAFFAATIGLVQNDIKRVIAYSTCSQLGYMFVACGVGAYQAGVFHLFTHAFFKALLFLGAGSVIHAMHHEQDMRKMGGLMPKLQFTWAMMLIGTLALTGFGIPHLAGFSGFYSKDAIIEASFAAHTAGNYAFWALVIAALLTSIYSWRLMFMTFHGKTRADHHTFDHAHESPPIMLFPLSVLAFGAVVAGAAMPFFIGEGQHEFWGKAIFNGEHNHILHAMHEIPAWAVWSPTVAMAAGFVIAYIGYIWAPSIPGALANTFRPLYLFLLNKWYFDELYNAIFVKPTFWLGNFLWKVGDIKIINGLIDGTAAGVYAVTQRAVRIQTGYVYHYAFVMLIGVALLVTYFMFMGGPH
ncbi:NADH-quinone oxidoreductase subunit L [Hyphomicrobium sp. NDB2Meth4]|uniref:NADH-quinone oxidoreductase subunit L n=1 Tax=Hyphomicrobium sp. NDB2Meth4 TaxID=1892846 RepID=UPI0009317E5D|nr:NADH-quinone oxidoreductase subunit L [Hyphomicrobium sp. NDB2Meth4]